MSERIMAGLITTAHGIKGEIKVRVDLEAPEFLNDIPLYAGQDSDDALKLRLKKPIKNFWLATVENVTTRNQAEELRGRELWLEREHLPSPADEDHFYVADLIGLPVEDKKGTKLGTVIAVDNFGASDLLEIKPATGDSFYLPFTREIFTTVEDERLVAEPPEYI